MILYLIRCDTCEMENLTQKLKRTRTTEQVQEEIERLQRKGWSITGKATLCPVCAHRERELSRLR